MALREPASHVLSTLSHAQLSDFAALDAALQTRFGRPRPRNLAVQTLKAAKQQSTQGLREFGLHVDTLCRETYRDDPVIGSNETMMEKLVMDNFMAGIADPSTRRLLVMSRPANLTEALVVTSELEDATLEPPPPKRIHQVEVATTSAAPSTSSSTNLTTPALNAMAVSVNRVLETLLNVIRAAAGDANSDQGRP